MPKQWRTNCICHLGMLARFALPPLPQQPSVLGPQPACVSRRASSRGGREHSRRTGRETLGTRAWPAGACELSRSCGSRFPHPASRIPHHWRGLDHRHPVPTNPENSVRRVKEQELRPTQSWRRKGLHENQTSSQGRMRNAQAEDDTFILHESLNVPAFVYPFLICVTVEIESPFVVGVCLLVL